MARRRQRPPYAGDTVIDSGHGYGQSYAHAIATMAIVEAYAMTQDPGLKSIGQAMVDHCLDRQNIVGDYPSGWSYNKGTDEAHPKPKDDASVSGWFVMALKSAAAGGLDIGDGMTGAKRYLENAWKHANDVWKENGDSWEAIGPYDESVFPYAYNPWDDSLYKEGRHFLDNAPMGALMAVFLGRKAGDTMLESMGNYIMNKQLPKAYPTDTYFMYYNTLAIFQLGGERWERWNTTVRDMLIDAQRPAGDGCFDGSWDWEGTEFHGNNTGRLLSTAFCCLSLEVYYRYVRVNP
ncbi:MAG: hypothetical protein ACOCXA_06945 [Planctomycetota bacterium]